MTRGATLCKHSRKGHPERSSRPGCGWYALVLYRLSFRVFSSVKYRRVCAFQCFSVCVCARQKRSGIGIRSQIVPANHGAMGTGGRRHSMPRFPTRVKALHFSQLCTQRMCELDRNSLFPPHPPSALDIVQIGVALICPSSSTKGFQKRGGGRASKLPSQEEGGCFWAQLQPPLRRTGLMHPFPTSVH